MRRLVQSIVCACLLLAGVQATRAETKVTLASIDLTFYAVSAAVVEAVLERLGHEVEIVSGTHSEMFPLLGTGEADLLNAVWLPHAHEAYWRRHGKSAETLTTLYEGAGLYWAVPAYVPEDMVSAIGHLAKPLASRNMAKRIQGTSASSGLGSRSIRAVDSYRLKYAGYDLRFGTEAEWRETFEAAYRAGAWAVLPMSRPRFVTKVYELRLLEDPKELLGGENDVVLAGHNDFIERAPSKTIATLRRIELGMDAVEEMDRMVVIDGLSPREAAQAWMAANAAKVDGWF